MFFITMFLVAMLLIAISPYSLNCLCVKNLTASVKLLAILLKSLRTKAQDNKKFTPKTNGQIYNTQKRHLAVFIATF